MDYVTLLDLAVDLGYEQAMSGAETFRVEESVNRVMAAYGVEGDVFAIPNYLVASITTDTGEPLTRMRRIGYHGNDLDAVEKFTNLSRAICSRTPEPKEALQWLDAVRKQKISYSTPIQYLGDFLGAAGFCLFFGGGGIDALCAGVCGLVVGFVNSLMSDMRANFFFRTIAASFLMAILAYGLGAAGICTNPDAATIGALMLLVPGLLFTNAMRDIIYGDINSGITRIVQVVLIACAIALGTATAWNLTTKLWGEPISPEPYTYSIGLQCLFSLIGCIGFSILFNIHGPGGLICAAGGVLSWAVYCIVIKLGYSDVLAFFWSALFASLFSEIIARIRKFPAISYLVVSIFPLIPGAGVYYTMNHAVRGNMDLFAQTGMHTAAVAGVMAVGILLVSTVFRMYTDQKLRSLQKKHRKC